MNSWKWIHENEFIKKMIFRNYESSSDVQFLVCWQLKIHEKNEFSSRGAAPNPAGGLTAPPGPPAARKSKRELVIRAKRFRARKNGRN